MLYESTATTYQLRYVCKSWNKYFQPTDTLSDNFFDAPDKISGNFFSSYEWQNVRQNESDAGQNIRELTFSARQMSDVRCYFKVWLEFIIACVRIIIFLKIEVDC